MARRLVSDVHVLGEDGFTPVVFGPDDVVPAWAAKQMGDHCFVDDGADKPAPKTSAKSTPKSGS